MTPRAGHHPAARRVGTTLLAWSSRLAALTLSCAAVSCTEASSLANLEADYVLECSDPEAANVTDILLRYEDDWLPGTCVGITQRWDATRVRIEWKCRLDTNVGATGPAPFEGMLVDDDGDGTFVGTLAVRTLPSLDATTLAPVGAYTYTMRPLP